MILQEFKIYKNVADLNENDKRTQHEISLIFSPTKLGKLKL